MKRLSCALISLMLASAPAHAAEVSFRALLIAADEYRDPKSGDLPATAREVARIGELLETRWGFTEVVTLTGHDASRDGIFEALDMLRDANRDDALLVYYTGHGKIDPETEQSFWVPTDADPERQHTWSATT